MDVPKGYQHIEGSIRYPVEGARRISDVDPNEIITITVLVRRRTNAEELPDPVAKALMSNEQQKHISHEKFAEQFGADPNELKLVEDFGRKHDLKIVESSEAKRIVKLSGTAKQMSEAFFVKLGRYRSPHETYRGREGHIYLPEGLTKVVEGVFGLDNRRMALRSENSGVISSLTPPIAVTSPLTPIQVANLYKFPTSTNGSGQTVGILEFGGGYNMNDINAFFSGIGLSTPLITDVSVDGATNTPGSDADGEVVLDIDVAGAVAPGAHIVVYFAPWTDQGWVDALTSAIHDATNKPSVLSISWGYPEGKGIDGVTWTEQAINAVHSVLYDATLLGVTVFAATGDWGSSSGFPRGKALVWYPPSDPYVTACGGTTILDVSGNSFTEKTWPETGGGISDVFPLPSWQQNIGVPPSVNDSHIGRGIPDVAGNADPESGYLININGQSYPIGGTSAVSPLYAGLIARINSILKNPAGYLNPKLYNYGQKPLMHVFRDINDGVCNASNGAPGYNSGQGWDACTGWGSIDGGVLLTALTSVGTITGTVSDRKTHDAIENANVTVETASTNTDNGGYYTLSDIPSGLQKVTVEAVNYYVLTEDITVLEGQTETVNFKLQPEGDCPSKKFPI
jgi:kumamolisin